MGMSRPKENTRLFASTSLAFLLGYSLCVADVLLFEVSLVQCQRQLLPVFLAHTALSKLMDHLSLSTFMTFITTLASFAASIRSTFFPKETVLESTCSVAQRAMMKSNCFMEHK